MFNVINSSQMNNWKTIQEFSRTPENIQGQQGIFQESRTWQGMIANSRTVLDAQGRLATLHYVLYSMQSLINKLPIIKLIFTTYI